MAINADLFKWADSDVNDPISGNPNKVEPDTSFKNSGLLSGEAIPRPYLNWQFDEYHKAFLDLQTQINGLVLSSGSALLETIYHVGSLYYSKNSTSPATRFGFGTWVRVKGRFIVGLDEDDTAFDGAGEEGGSKTHIHLNTLSVSGHALTISEMPTHTVSTTIPKGERASGGQASGETLRADNLVTNGTKTVVSDPVGSNQAHTHGLTGGVSSATSLPPYKAYYIWERTA